MAERDPRLGGGARSVRIDLAQPGMVTDSDGGRVAVVVRDLSKDGCRLSTDGSLIEGEAVMLAVGKGQPVPALVAWALGDEAGLHFTAPAAIG